MGVSGDLYIEGVGESPEKVEENFRRLRLALQDLESRVAVDPLDPPAPYKPFTPGSTAYVTLVPVNLNAGEWKTVYNGTVVPLSFRVVMQGGEDITEGLDIIFEERTVQVKSNLSLSNLKVYVGIP